MVVYRFSDPAIFPSLPGMVKYIRRVVDGDVVCDVVCDVMCVVMCDVMCDVM